jgi:hypothetical protein
MMKKLNEIPDKSPFKVPENYFEEVNRKILSATSGYNHEVRKTGFLNRFRSSLAIAATVAGFIILSYVTLKLVTPEKDNTQLSEVMVQENTENYINDIDLLTLEENAASVGISEVRPELSKGEIIDYLLSENIEISDIYEQL